MPIDPTSADTEPGTPEIGELLEGEIIEATETGQLKVVVPDLDGGARPQARRTFGVAQPIWVAEGGNDAPDVLIYAQPGDPVRVMLDHVGVLVLMAWEPKAS